MSRKILGLDIRKNSVSAVVVASSIKGNEVESFYHNSWKANGEDQTADQIRVLQNIVEDIDLSEVECVASFPAELASYRNIQVPFKETRKIKQVLQFELEPTMPLPIDQAVIDFQNISHPKQHEQTCLLAAVIEKEKLDKFISDLKSVNVNPQVATISGYSIAMVIAKQASSPNQFLVIDVYDNRSTLFAISSGQIQTIRSIVFSHSLTRPAESICKGVVQTVSAVEDILGIEFVPEIVFLTGPETDKPDFKEEIASSLELSVTSVDLIQDTGIQMKEFADQSWIPEQMDNALALAIAEFSGSHGLNFHRRQFAAKKHWNAYRKDIIQTATLAGIILSILLFNLFYDFYSMSREKADLDSQISNIYKQAFPDSAIEDAFVQQRQMRVEVDELKNQFTTQGSTGKDLRSIDILNEISGRLPKEMDIELDNLVIGPDNVTIAGDTATFNSVDEMKNLLEKGGFFQKVTISSANSDKTGKRISFKLKLDI
jgi:general secretion pathway protein L